MADIAQRGNKLTLKKILTSDAGRDIIRNVYDAVAPKHSPGQKGKPHSSKEGRTASIGRTLRDTMKILTGAQRDRKFGGGRTNLLEQLGRVEAEPSNRNRRAEISRVHGELNRGYVIGGGVKKVISKLRPGVFKKKGKKTHAKAIPTMAAKGGRIGLKKGSVHKPGSHSYFLHQIHKPRVKKAHGMSAGKQAIRRMTERLGGGEEGKPHSTRAGRIAAGVRRIKRGLSARQRDKWGDLPPWKRDPKTLPKQPWTKGPKGGRIGKKHGKDVPTMAAEGGRIGLKKGGSDKKWIQKAVDPKHKGYCTPMTKKTCTPARKALARTFKKKAKTGWG